MNKFKKISFIDADSLLVSSESVSIGHPDKICDQISDAILDDVLKQDPNARVACEVLISNQTVVIAGQITTIAKVDYAATARRVLKEIGYNSIDIGCDYRECSIIEIITKQSAEIAAGVDLNANEFGAGDQGVMYGYATDETEHFMPLPITLSHALVSKASSMRLAGQFQWARPDMKAEVVLDMKDPNQPVLKAVLMSIQHDPDYNQKLFFDFIYKEIILKTIKNYQLNLNFKFLINPAGTFVQGGPTGDTGLTGRKIIVDSYGGAAHHGGGCFSGKDGTKMDRTGAYMARYVAKNVVAAGLAKRCEVTLTYAIGKILPLAVNINTFSTNIIAEEKINAAIIANFDFRPVAMIKKLKLKHPFFQATAKYGHFGRPAAECPWEALDKVAALKAATKLKI